MLYTGRGDDGTTKTFGSKERILKSSLVAEALGALDETNSFLGLIRFYLNKRLDFKISDKNFSEIIFEVQQNLFIIQAEVAGSEMNITEEKLRACEGYIENAEKILPPITTFFISGEGEESSFLDIARTLIRKTERRVIAFTEDEVSLSVENSSKKIHKTTLAYLNRLSSLFYVMARLANHFNNIDEKSPSYK